jgi:hypothetical protein
MTTYKKYNKLNEKSLKGNLLILYRDNYIKTIAKQLMSPEYNIVPLEYIDEKLRLDFIKNNIEYDINTNTNNNNNNNNNKRLEFLTNILLKECSKGTSKIISDLCK